MPIANPVRLAATQCSQFSVRRALEDGERERLYLSRFGAVPDWRRQMDHCFGPAWRGPHARSLYHRERRRELREAYEELVEAVTSREGA